MKKNQKNYVIGVDGGGTKTIAALADLKGKILAKDQAGPSNPRNVGIERAVFNVTKTIKMLFKKTKKEDKIISTFIALPSIEEEYGGKKKDILRLLRKHKEISKIFKGRVTIGSDQAANFRAGTDKKNGILLIAGTGAVSHGWRGKKEFKASGWGWLGDEGSAFWVGHKVLQAIWKDLDKRGPKTFLTKLVLKEFEVGKLTSLSRKIYSENPTGVIPRLAAICDKASKKRDKAATRILIEAGRELSLNIKTAIRELKFQKMKFPLVLVGSMLNSRIVLNQVEKEIKKVAPHAEFILCQKEPALGAVELAIENLPNKLE